ncbi:hypothetical protein OHC33_001356 [Knufia fluminis]|uniref:Uncharacterized protein n=1 Tax=Knufia fluminis TaxID=191047 RepID=A0AAN8I6M2_9EURO|nr:hypothetical protein OHC33_001356 [Knufia fluminis]
MFAIYYVLCLTTVFMFLTLAHPFEPVANASNNVLVRRQRSGRTPQPYDYTCGSDCEGASLITFLKACVQLIIDKVSDEQHKKEEQFTQSQLDQLRRNWPHLNAAIIQDPPAPIVQDFLPTLTPPPNELPYTPTDPIVPERPTRLTNGDGIYMVNCQKDAVISSGVAYYKQLRDGGAWGEQPDDYVDTSHGVYTNWEMPGNVTFSSINATVSWKIDNDAQMQTDFAAVGTADNTYVNFWVYKDKQPNTLYTLYGWNCTSVYWGY